MTRERSTRRIRRATRSRRRGIWALGGAVLVVAFAVLAATVDPVGPPPSRPPGAGLPPQALPPPAFPTTPPSAPSTRAAAEEARLAALRATRAQLEQDVAALRAEIGRLRQQAQSVETPANPLSTAGATTGPDADARSTAATDGVADGLRVFVHHRANSRLGASAAEEVAERLRTAGAEVPAIRAAPFVPSTPVVRYFHEEDQAAAARLAGRLGRGWAIQDFRAYLPQPPPHTLEVWLATD